jgi:hypothetical protein
MAGIVIGVGLSSEIRVDSLFLGMVIFEAEYVELELELLGTGADFRKEKSTANYNKSIT